MKADYYVDSVLGDWAWDKKDRKHKGFLVYRRQADVNLHKDHCMPHTDPITNNKFWVHGEVILRQTKYVEKETSKVSYMRELILTENSVKIPVIE